MRGPQICGRPRHSVYGVYGGRAGLRILVNMEDIDMRRCLWLLMVFSYSLLFGSGLVVIVGSAYVLFFAPVQGTDPSSLNQNTPLWQKVAYLVFTLCVVAAGYAVNRSVWSRFLRRSKRNDIADSPAGGSTGLPGSAAPE